MTRVYFDDEKFGRFKVTAKEHADNPIVCSGISAVLFELAGMIKNTDSIDDEVVKLDPGDVVIEFKGDRTAKIVFDMTLIGLLNIRASHPENLEVFLNGKAFGGER